VPNLLLDTGPLVALLNRDEKSHEVCVDFFKSFRGRLLSTEPVLTEGLYLLGDSFSNQKKCMEFVFEAVQLIPSSRSSLERSLHLLEKYQDIPMDFADATLVALAEEVQVGEIFTLDRRDFEIYRWGRNRAFKIYPN
jgi:predicted nucleic acid-binding protein